MFSLSMNSATSNPKRHHNANPSEICDCEQSSSISLSRCSTSFSNNLNQAAWYYQGTGEQMDRLPAVYSADTDENQNGDITECDKNVHLTMDMDVHMDMDSNMEITIDPNVGACTSMEILTSNGCRTANEHHGACFGDYDTVTDPLYFLNCSPQPKKQTVVVKPNQIDSYDDSAGSESIECALSGAPSICCTSYSSMIAPIDHIGVTDLFENSSCQHHVGGQGNQNGQNQEKQSRSNHITNRKEGDYGWFVDMDKEYYIYKRFKAISDAFADYKARIDQEAQLAFALKARLTDSDNLRREVSDQSIDHLDTASHIVDKSLCVNTCYFDFGLLHV